MDPGSPPYRRLIAAVSPPYRRRIAPISPPNRRLIDAVSAPDRRRILFRSAVSGSSASELRSDFGEGAGPPDASKFSLLFVHSRKHPKWTRSMDPRHWHGRRRGSSSLEPSIRQMRHAFPSVPSSAQATHVSSRPRSGSFLVLAELDQYTPL